MAIKDKAKETQLKLNGNCRHLAFPSFFPTFTSI